MVINNIWGKGNIKQFSQCIGTDKTSSNTGSVSWTWNWPRYNYDVKAFPSILYGRKPWYTFSTTPDLPIQIATLDRMFVTFSVSEKSKGAYNLLLESWITDNKYAGPTNRIGEVAVHLFEHNWPGQAGHFVEKVTVNGITFDFYVEENMQVPGDQHSWAYYGFLNRWHPVTETDIDMGLFIKYLVDKGYLDKTQYVASVELGNEIAFGNGQTVVDRFAVSVKKNH